MPCDRVLASAGSARAFDDQLARVGQQAQVDFNQNLLTQRRLQRSRERAYIGDTEAPDLVAFEESRG